MARESPGSPVSVPVRGNVKKNFIEMTERPGCDVGLIYVKRNGR